MAKEKKQKLPSVATLVHLAKSIPTKDRWDGYPPEVKATEDAAESLRRKLLKNTRLLALERKAKSLRDRHDRAIKEWNERRWRIITSIRLKGVSAALVKQVEQMLGL